MLPANFEHEIRTNIVIERLDESHFMLEDKYNIIFNSFSFW